VAIGVVSVAPRRIRATPGVLGVSLEDGSGAAKITEVMPRSAAEKAGLKKDDLVLSINGTAVKGREEMVRNVQGHKPGDVIKLKVKRGEEELDFKATLGSHFTGPAGRGDVQDMLGGSLSMRRAGFAEAMQHDTVLQPFQCGGPVVDLDGKAVGINIARAGRVNSYALPAKLILAAIEDLKSGKLSPEALSEKAEMIAALNLRIEEMSAAAGKAQAGYQQAEKDLSAAKDALAKAQAALEAAQKQLEAQKVAQDQAQAELEKLRKEREALQPAQ
jgi:serine protease Do